MKPLISVKEIEDLKKSRQKVCHITCDTIVTPSARDEAESAGIEIVCRESINQNSVGQNSVGQNNTGQINICREKDADNFLSELSMDSAQLYKVLKVLIERGMLENMRKPYEEERHSKGLKVIRGKTVSMDVFDTGNPKADVHYQELVNKEESHMSAGFLVIDHSDFDWELTYEEIDYVIEGTLQVTIDGTTLTAYAGDVLYVPSGSKVNWCSPDKARIFYATYPADWSDRM